MHRTALLALVLVAACDKSGPQSEPPQPKEGGLLESIDQSGEEIGDDIDRGLNRAAEELSMDEPEPEPEADDEDSP